MNRWETGLLFTPLSSGCLHWEPFRLLLIPGFWRLVQSFPRAQEEQAGMLEEAEDLTELSPENTRAKNMSAPEKQVWETWLVMELPVE